jgi:hypothetical protein
MVHFPGFARARLWIHRAVRRVYLRGFPHSEIPGSKPACGSPRLIAACHVLLRLLLPRHPPCALSSLTTKFTQHTRSLPASGFRFPLEANRIHRSISWAYDPAHRVLDVLNVPRPSRVLSGTHKNLRSPCNCPIYSVVKYRPHDVSQRRLTFTYPRLAGMGLTHFRNLLIKTYARF